MKNSRRLVFALLLALLAASPPAPWRAPAQKDRAPGEFPLRITAARLEADQKSGIIVFSGKVKADYGDSTLYADELRVFFKAKPEAPKDKAAAPAPQAENQGPLGDLGGEKIDRIVARGQVRFVQEDRVATGERGDLLQGPG